ncbi:MAG: phosphoribosyltransferase family protein, partial [Zestosphaera sp.]
MSEFLILTWKKKYEAVLELALDINKEGLEIDLIVGILRGGYIVARILSDILGTDNIGVVEVKFYRGIEERAERPIITQPLTADVRGKNILIVDDVVDSGRTLEIVTEQVRLRGARSVKTAVL